VLKQTLALAEEPNTSNSPITEFTYALEQMEEGVFSSRTQTRCNAVGGLLVSVQKQLISKHLHLSSTDLIAKTKS